MISSRRLIGICLRPSPVPAKPIFSQHFGKEANFVSVFILTIRTILLQTTNIHWIQGSIVIEIWTFCLWFYFPFDISCRSEWMNRIHGLKYRALSNLAERYLGGQWPFGLNLQIVLHIWFKSHLLLDSSRFKRHWRRHRRHWQKNQNKIFFVWVSRLEMSFKLVFLLWGV